MSLYESYVTSFTNTTTKDVNDVKTIYNTTELRKYFKEGNTIKGSHLAKLQDSIDRIRNHTHTYVDLYMLGEFNDGAAQGIRGETVRDTGVSSAVDTANIFSAAEFESGKTIKVSHHGRLRLICEELALHRHEYTDYYNQDSL